MDRGHPHRKWVYGCHDLWGSLQDRLQLNETTLYSDDPKATFKALSVRKDFPKVSRLLEEEKYNEAQGMILKNWLGRAQECYQPLGDLWIDFKSEKSGKYVIEG